ncbi:hypothetical protein [Aliishimia ponticola]|nr:hypothetical protein [Aliishimia ponticola]
MKSANETAKPVHGDRVETLMQAFDLGLPGLLNLEWIMDRMEHGERVTK